MLRPEGRVNAHVLHQLIWKAFPDQPKRPFLFCADRTRIGRRPVIECLVQSTHEPRWSRLENVVVDALVKKYTPEIRAGDQLRFKLRANVVRSRVVGGPGDPKVRGRRVPILTHDERMEWLHHKLRGARVLEAMITGSQVWTWRHSPRQPAGRLTGVDFVGLLVVEDADAFLDIVRHGVGPGKGFGFGLLNIARVG